MKSKLSTVQIGRCGELLVQYQLLTRGIESAPMTTDSGIDLVAYASDAAKAITIQVKANLQAKSAGGGRGKPALDWWIDIETPAELVAFVNLSDQSTWLFKLHEIAKLAQQQSSGRYHLYMYTDPSAKPSKPDRKVHQHEFESFRLENRTHLIFGR